MDLSTLEQYNARVAPSKQLAPISTCAGYAQAFPKGVELKEHVRRERETFAEFRLALGMPPDASHAYPRQFCGREGMVLYLPDAPVGDTATATDPNGPIWNIRTRSPILVSHGDLTNPLLWQFVRQLYYDSEDDTLKTLLK
jgi:hypothetical protein